MTEKGSGTILSVCSGEGSGYKGGPHGMFHRSDETGSSQRASNIAHHSRSGNTGYGGLPEDARGSVSDKAGEVEEPEAAEVVAGDLV